MVNSVPSEWTKYQIALPAGARHFAIRSFATGSFMLMVDDVTFTPASMTSGLTVEGYNVFRDGQQINDAVVTETTYTDSNIENNGHYVYAVTAVYGDRGQSAASESAEIHVVLSGVDDAVYEPVKVLINEREIVVINASGSDVNVANINGTTIYKARGGEMNVISVDPGIYIVKIGAEVHKVFVR